MGIFWPNRFRERERAEQSLAAFCTQLAELGVETVEITYDGYGDSGTIEDATAFAGEQEIELPPQLNQTLVDAAESLLPCGWEINDGAFGQLILDVAQKQVRREHNTRTTEYEEEAIDL